MTIIGWLFIAWTVIILSGCWTHNVIEARKPSKMITPPKPKEGSSEWLADKMIASLEEASKDLAIPQQPVKSYELYGHPAPPILVLSASLPSAPIGYGWELTTAINVDGNPALRLSMLDLKSSIAVDTLEGDLVIIRRWKYAKDDTYADFYRRAEAEEKSRITGYERTHYGYREPIYGADPAKLLGKVMLANLITPMVDWASLLVLRYIVEHPDETKCNYILLESNEEAHVS